MKEVRQDVDRERRPDVPAAHCWVGTVAVLHPDACLAARLDGFGRDPMALPVELEIVARALERLRDVPRRVPQPQDVLLQVLPSLLQVPQAAAAYQVLATMAQIPPKRVVQEQQTQVKRQELFRVSPQQAQCWWGAWPDVLPRVAVLQLDALIPESR